MINEIIMKAKVTKKKKETDWENTLKLYHTFCLFVNDLMMYFIYSKYELTVDINICSKRDNSTIWKRPDFFINIDLSNPCYFSINLLIKFINFYNLLINYHYQLNGSIKSHALVSFILS